MTASRSEERATRAVVTARSLERCLEQLGVRRGSVLLVHASLSALGYVVHGVDALRVALERALGEEGTLLVPTFTGDLVDPSSWVDPALPASMWNEVRDGMPCFDPSRSMPRLMGQLATSVLLDPHRRRSDHPICSFAALGPRAEELVEGHELRDPFGPKSPVARARELDGQVLLLGVDQRRNSAMIHAHCLANAPQVRRNKGLFLAGSAEEREWVAPLRLSECTEGYGRIELELAARGLVRVARAGDATARLMRLQPFVAAVEHLVRLRPESVLCGRPACRQCGP
jgi:aminoglycoside 3-N-acetyltransferase